MLPLEIRRLIKHILQSPLLSNHPLDRLANIALEPDITTPWQPPQDMKRIRIHTRRAGNPPIIRQTSLQYNPKRLQPPAIPQAEAHEIGKAVKDIVVRGYGENDVFDQAPAALVQGAQRVDAARQTERKDIVAVEHLPRLPIYRLVQPQNLRHNGIRERYALRARCCPRPVESVAWWFAAGHVGGLLLLLLAARADVGSEIVVVFVGFLGRAVGVQQERVFAHEGHVVDVDAEFGGELHEGEVRFGQCAGFWCEEATAGLRGRRRSVLG